MERIRARSDQLKWHVATVAVQVSILVVPVRVAECQSMVMDLNLFVSSELMNVAADAPYSASAPMVYLNPCWRDSHCHRVGSTKMERNKLEYATIVSSRRHKTNMQDTIAKLQNYKIKLKLPAN